MPLKHRSETAYLLLLGLIICVAGFLISLLPSLPGGLVPWAVLFVLSGLYPLMLHRMFRVNRVDYEFRMLHWFPACMFFAWLLLQIISPHVRFFYILQLGLWFLWSVLVVLLGLFFEILFASHVIRRSRIRITMLSLFMLVYTAGAVTAEARGWNRSLQAVFFDAQGTVAELGKRGADAFLSFIWQGRGSGTIVIGETSSSSTSFVSSSSRSSGISSSISSSETIPATIRKPRRLAKSGPESVAFLASTLLALYSCTLHRRAKNRV